MSKSKIPESTTISKVEPFSFSCVPPKEMVDEKLAVFVAEGAARVAVFCEQLKPYYWELRIRFTNKKSKSDTIHGCKTWDEYCAKTLDRTKRAVNYFLAGGNPVSKRLPAWTRTSSHRTGDAQTRLHAFQEQVERATASQDNPPGGKPFPTQTISVQMIEREPAPPTTVYVEMQSEKRKPMHPAVALEPAPVQNYLRTDSHARDSKKWLCVALEEFEAYDYSVVDPEEILLSPDELEILRNCRDWMDRILRAQHD